MSNSELFSESENKKRDMLYLVSKIRTLTSVQLAEFYFISAYSQWCLKVLKDAYWMKFRSDPKGGAVEDIVDPFLDSEFVLIQFLHQFLKDLSWSQFKKIVKILDLIEILSVFEIRSRSYDEQIEFSRTALTKMAHLFVLETKWQKKCISLNQELGLNLYRTFDRLDEVFNFSYHEELSLQTKPEETERLYEGAGVGVQSGYSTILTALNHLSDKERIRFVDLGSGYGRVGVIVGLMRSNWEFIGYEFVPHRVHLANEICKNFGLTKSASFYVQDLSKLDFKIPEADVYYLYDPFNESTYRHVLRQLVELGSNKNIVIITKGNAKKWLLDIAQKEGWSAPLQFDSGNLCFFSSTNQNPLILS